MKRCTVPLTLLALTLLPTKMLFGHCDTMNGPVVIAAQRALETGNVDLVLIWVKEDDEGVIREAFTRTLNVRKLSVEARKLADMFFFETLVRIHRAGEGVAYTGLKAEETTVEPGIEAADKALDRGSVEELLDQLNAVAYHGLNERFTNTMAKRRSNSDNVEAGRDYVKAYVEFIHYAERLFQAASAPAEEHSHESEEVGIQEHKH